MPVPIEINGNVNSFARAHNIIMDILDSYMDLTDMQKKIITAWAIAAAFKDNFNTMPILYLNAPRASGKTRLLKILSEIIPDAALTISMTEATLFRYPQQRHLNALFIDEAEGITKREQGNLKELLNACYKKGTKVLRQHKDKKTEEYTTDEFDFFMALGVANIFGLESILESRAITLVLDRSVNREITRKIEAFSLDTRFVDAQNTLKSLFSVGGEGSAGMYAVYLSKYYTQLISMFNILPIYTLPTQPQLPTQHTQPTLPITDIYRKIDESELLGRDLELWLPLILVSYMVNNEIGGEMIEIAEVETRHKHESAVIDDHDTTFLLFLAEFVCNHDDGQFISINNLRSTFREEEGIDKHDNWPSQEWIGRALKRFNVITNRRRVAKGKEVTLNKGLIIEKVRRLSIQNFEEKEEIKIEPITLGNF